MCSCAGTLKSLGILDFVVRRVVHFGLRYHALRSPAICACACMCVFHAFHALPS